MNDSSTTVAAAGGDGARGRILDAAYELFSHHGLQAVGINSILKRSGVAKRTLYRHFASKEELIVEFLRMREQRWTREWLQREVDRRVSKPDEKLLAIFDVFDEWFQEDDLEGCSFINVLLEVPERASPVRQASVEHLAEIRRFLARLASEAGIQQPDDFARRWHILMKGSIVQAAERDRDAAKRARELGALLIERHR